MKLEQLQKDWNALGQRDPYWAILTHDAKAQNRWDPEEFFRTAEREVAEVLEFVASCGVKPQLRRALDFGCGVGRLTQALCPHFEACHGVDIAPSMIALARKHNRYGLRCTYSVNDSDDLSAFEDGSFDFVLSLLVLQHMAPDYAKRYLREFVRVLRPGGVLVFQLPSERVSSPGLTVIDRPLVEGGFRAEIDFAARPSRMTPGQSATVHARVTNRGTASWPAVGASGPGPFALHLGNHWLGEEGRTVMSDDGRAPLPRDVAPGAEFDLALVVQPPREPGRYLLELDMVQEGVTWFAGKGSPTARAPVEVRAPSWFEQRLEVFLGRSRPAEPAPLRMEMHGIPQVEVAAILEGASGRVVAVSEDGCAGPSWRSFRYCVTKAV